MANSLSTMSPTFWSRIMGKKLYKSVVYKSIASSDEKASLSYGLKVDRPYRSNLAVENYVKGTAATAQDLTATSDQLTIDKQKTILMYVDDVDKLQNKWDAAKAWAEEAAKRLGVAIDAEVLYEVVNANNVVDDSDLGGTAGNGITLTTSNVAQVFSKVNRKLDIANVDFNDRFFVISPQFKDILWQYASGKESLFGDKTAEFNNMGRYAGLELYVSNNLTASAVWTPANNPSNSDTITIAGVTFTFVSSIGTTAGNVLIGSTTADTLDNIVAMINDPSTTSATQVALSVANQRIVSQMVAVDGTTILTVYHKGGSYLTVTGSDSNDTWTKKLQHNLAGSKGAIDVVVQQEPDVQMASTVSAGKRGMNVMPLTVFGVKTFNQGKDEIVNVKVSSSGF